jgi:hypothetical protein
MITAVKVMNLWNAGIEYLLQRGIKNMKLLICLQNEWPAESFIIFMDVP